MKQAPVSRPRASFVQRLRRRLFRTIPLLAWLLAIATVGWLVHLTPDQLPYPGETQVLRYQLTAPAEGRLIRLLVEEQDVVQKDQVLGQLDDRPLSLRLRQAKARLQQLTAEMNREAKLHEMKGKSKASNRELSFRRFLRDRETAHVELLEARASLEEDKIRLQGTLIELQRIEKLTKQDLAAEADMIRVKTEHDALDERVKQLEAVVSQQRDRFAAAEGRVADFRKGGGGEGQPIDDALLEPFRWRIESQRVELDEIELARKSLAITAPGDGRVDGVLCHPGQQLRLGQPLLSITAPRPKAMVAYVPEVAATRLAPGMRAQVQIRSGGATLQVLTTSVVSLGLVQQEVPAYLLVDPRQPQWARPVYLEIPADWQQAQLPGQALRVRFLNE